MSVFLPSVTLIGGALELVETQQADVQCTIRVPRHETLLELSQWQCIGSDDCAF